MYMMKSFTHHIKSYEILSYHIIVCPITSYTYISNHLSYQNDQNNFFHLHGLALLLHGDGGVALVVRLCTLDTQRSLVVPAEHLQRPVVLSAEAAVGEGGWVGQPVSLQRRLSLVRRQVGFTVRHLADQARLDGL